jgi:cell division protein FtsB
MGDDPSSVEAFEWETAIAFAKQLTEPWPGMGELANYQRRLAAEMIVRLYNRCNAEAAHIAELKGQVRASADQCRAQHREIQTLRAERDEARREVCENVANEMNGPPIHVSGFYTAIMAIYKKRIAPRDVARKRGWDCFADQNAGTSGHL